MTAVDYHALALGPSLGQGARGTAFAVYNAKVHQQFDAVYKEYRPDVLPEVDFAALEAMTALVPGLLGDEGRWLCERTAWPAGLVERDGQHTGYLMRVVPAPFRVDEQQSRAGAATATSFPAIPTPQGSGIRLATFEYLLADSAAPSGGGPQLGAHDRLLLLADLAVTLDRLHRLGIAVGNLSPRNLLFATHPAPHCFLIGCDTMRLDGRSALPQTEADEWRIPAGEEAATAQSDAYKFGLIAIRMFARDRNSVDTYALAAMDPALGTLASAGIGPDPAGRPAPGEWVGILNSAAATVSNVHGATTATGLPLGSAAAPPAPAAPSASSFSNMTTQVPGYAPALPAPKPAPALPPAPMPASASPFSSAASSWDPSASSPYGAPGGGYGAAPVAPYSPQPVMHPAHANRRILGPVLVGAVGLAVVIGAGFSIHAILDSRSHNTNNTQNTAGSQTTYNAAYPSSPTAPADASSSPSPSPSPSPTTSVGMIQIAAAFVADARSAAVASMFDSYFTGIDQKDYQAALAEYDPAGTVNPNDAQQAQSFEQGVSTSNDTNIVLVNIGPADQTAPATSAEVTFQSTQAAGMGPLDAPSETCTKWQLTYVLTQSTNGSYLIYNVSSATDQAC